jgi:4-amino-4-deoxy-L-arabinose transferase-like glycosyltransferase
MPTAPVRRVAPVLLTAGSLIFLALGLVLIPLAGVQDDEVLFTGPLFVPAFDPYSLAIFHHHPPLMVFPYTGALKTYLYWPILHLFGSNPYSLRLPLVLAGVLTILGFYYFAKQIAGIYAALFAALLLASDPSFLLANTFDWGPVALQHFFLVAGCCLLVRGNLRSAGLVFGLGLWDKAVFVWPLAGLAAGALAAYYPEIREALRAKRRIAETGLAFLIGVSPLLIYNIQSRSQTVRSTAHFSLEHLPLKVEELNLALDGSGLFGFLAAQEWEGDPKPAASLQARIADRVHRLFGDRQSSLFPLAVVIALFAAPFWWRSSARKPALFASVFSIVTFAFMAITRDAGEAVHHTILLWPMPHLLVGVVLAALNPRWVSSVLGSVLALSNLLVTNQYIFQLDHYGAHGNFTDAIYPVAEDVRVAQAANAAGHIYLMDWGLTETLTFLGRGKLPLFPGADPFFTARPDAEQQALISKMFADTQGLFIGHIPEREVFTGVYKRLVTAAGESGYRKEIVCTIPDSNHRPVFEIFRLRKVSF